MAKPGSRGVKIRSTEKMLLAKVLRGGILETSNVDLLRSNLVLSLRQVFFGVKIWKKLSTIMHIRERHTLVYPSRISRSEDWLRFVHGDSFEKKWSKLKLTDDDLRALEIAIMLGPKRPPVIRGTRGMRKLRYGDAKSARGKSAAFRIYYAHFQEYSIVLLATVFGKNEADDLTDAGKAAMAALIEDIKSQLESGLIQ